MRVSAGVDVVDVLHFHRFVLYGRRLTNYQVEVTSQPPTTQFVSTSRPQRSCLKCCYKLERVNKIHINVQANCTQSLLYTSNEATSRTIDTTFDNQPGLNQGSI